MRSGQSHLIPRCVTAIVQSVGSVEVHKVHLFSREDQRLQPGQVLAPASAPGGRASAWQRQGRASAPEDGASSRWPAWLWPVSADSRARCRCRPCPRPHPGPACTQLVHAHCPHVCSARASADAGDLHAAVRTAPFQARTAPGNLLQGEIKNQT